MWQYVELEGKRYSHIVDPRTGIGLTDHSMVTLVGSDSTVTDGLTKAVEVLGPEKGLELIDATPGMAGFILRAPRGVTEVYASKRWKDLPVAPPRETAEKSAPNR
jgi:thiamine biosynthesis lipoprotein